jgi:hypothetical protein
MKAMSIALEVWKIGRERSNGSGGGSGRAVEWVELWWVWTVMKAMLIARRVEVEVGVEGSNDKANPIHPIHKA